MRAQSPSAQSAARRARPPRRVVLARVVRRDAAQRLSLALTLLIRASSTAHVPARAARVPVAEAVAPPAAPRCATQEEAPQ